MKSTKDELNDYGKYLDDVYGEDNPRRVKRFADAFFEFGRLNDADFYFDLHALYRRHCSLDLLFLLFSEDIRGNFHDLEEEQYMIKPNVFIPTPKDVGGFIDDCVRFEIPLHWKENIYTEYFIKE